MTNGNDHAEVARGVSKTQGDRKPTSKKPRKPAAQGAKPMQAKPKP